MAVMIDTSKPSAGDHPVMPGVEREIRKALFEPAESDACDNLEGALIDIERLSSQGKPTDDVCIRTIRRVLKQLSAVHAVLALIEQ
jgi:hypothetical protein